MFPSPLTQCFSLKRRLFFENQPIFVGRLPIEIFYFGNFQWPFFGKITGQKPLSHNCQHPIKKYKEWQDHPPLRKFLVDICPCRLFALNASVGVHHLSTNLMQHVPWCGEN